MESTISLEACPTQLSDAHREAFARDGYLAFSDVLSAQELEEARDAIRELVHLAASEGEKRGLFWVLPDSKFGVQFEKGFVPEASDPDLELKVRKLMWFTEFNAHLHFLAHEHPKLRAVREALLGSDPLMFQDMALVKPPFIGSEKPWHQDNAYFAVEPLLAVCGIWIALDDATVENGCMHVLPGGHREGALKHIHDRDCEIPVSKIDTSRVVPVEIPAGGALFFAGMLPHQTPENSSPERRRALQFHYRRKDSQIVSREQYDKTYSEFDGMTGESIPASCANGWKE